MSNVIIDLKNIDILVDGNKQIKINCDLKWQVEAVQKKNSRDI